AGLDSIDVLVDLRAAHEESPYMGLDVFDGEIVDMKDVGVIEPHRVKKQAIQSAAEAAEMILRIDDVIAASSSGSDEDMDMGDMGGMPPM
ncbi:TCP-1/cpn60 chaperonin family protein, partial [Methanothermobacter sp.]